MRLSTSYWDSFKFSPMAERERLKHSDRDPSQLQLSSIEGRMDYILTPTLVRLDELLSQEVNVLSEIVDHVKILQTKLISLQDILKQVDAENFGRINELCSDLSSIIDAAHEAEDVIENYVLKRESVAAGGAINFIKRLAFNDEHEAIIKIKAIIHRFSNILQTHTIQALSQPSRASEKASSQDKESSFSSREIRQPSEPKRCNKPPLVGHTIIGIKEKVEEVVESLLYVRKSPFVSIFGGPGAGKTTLAKEVYHHTVIRRHFDYFAWVDFFDLAEYENDCLVRGVDGVSVHACLEILWSLISTGEQMDDNVKFAGSEEIESKLVDFLQKKKCLVVLDDRFSSCGLLKCVVDFFLEPSNWHLSPKRKYISTTGSKFLLISSSGLWNKGGVTVHEPRYFSSEDAWKLLQTIINSVKDFSDFDMQLEKIGRNIAQVLDGRPWTIKLVGAILAAKQCQIEWKRVHHQLVLDIDVDKDPLWNLLMLSYMDLPTRLKPCLFYLSQLPWGYEINVSRLVRIWIAEGFVSSRMPETADEGETLEDLAESNLIELILRCLVLVGDRDARLRVKTCHLHEIVRSFFLSKSRLVCLKGDLTDIDYSVHHYVHSYRFPTSGGAGLRSLLLFQGRSYRSSTLSYPNFDKHRLLRVLDLEGADFGEENLPKSIGDLIYLRYLSLRNARVSKIPSTLGNLRFLQTLDLLVEGKSVYIPNVIWKLNRLRHLFLPEVCHTKAKLRLDTLTNLRTLVNFPARNCDPKDIFMMTKLRELTIRDAMSIRNFARFSKLVGMRLKHLQSFSLHDSNREGDKGAEEFEDINSASFGDTVDPRS